MEKLRQRTLALRIEDVTEEEIGDKGALVSTGSGQSLFCPNWLRTSLTRHLFIKQKTEGPFPGKLNHSRKEFHRY